MKIYCKFCGSSIAPADIGLKDSVVKCDRCNNIFTIVVEDGLVCLVTRKQGRPKAYKRSQVDRPGGIKVEREAGCLRIVYKSSLWMLLVYGISLLIVGSYGGANLYYGFMDRKFLYLFIAFSSCLLALLTLYNTMKRVEVTVTRREIKTKYFPLPLKSDYDVDPPLSFYVERYLWPISFNKRRTYTYNLRMKDGEGYDLKIVKGLASETDANYILQEIEDFLDDFVV